MGGMDGDGGVCGGFSDGTVRQQTKSASAVLRVPGSRAYRHTAEQTLLREVGNLDILVL